MKRAIEINFKRLHGKIYSPNDDGDFVLMALEKSEAEENAQLIADINPFFYIYDDFVLDDDVNELLKNKRQARHTLKSYKIEENFVDMMAAEPMASYSAIERVFDYSAIKISFLEDKKSEILGIKPLEEELVLVGYLNGNEHMKQIRRTKMYYVRTGSRNGSIHLVEGFGSCKYLFLHDEQCNQCLMFKLTGEGPRIFTSEQLSKKGISVGNPNEAYLVYKLSSTEEVSFKDIDVRNAILQGKGYHRADSYFTTLKELFNIQ